MEDIDLGVRAVTRAQGLTGLREKRQLRFGIAAGVGQRGGIVSRKTMIGILRPDRIAAFFTHCTINAIDRQKSQGVATDIGAHFIERVGRGEQFIGVPAYRSRNNRDG